MNQAALSPSSEPNTAADANQIIQLKDVAKTYRTDRIETIALNDVDLTINAGETVSIMGPSGCGKSTLLNLVGLLDRPSSGQVRISGLDPMKNTDKELAAFRNETIGFVFQSFHLINDLTVLDNVQVPLLYRSMSNKERAERAQAALEKVGLASRTRHFPNQLSGGQQQRVAIARAIVGEPKLVLADEPTGNLDSHMGDEIMDLLLGLNASDGTTMLMVTHDKGKAEQTQRVVRIFDGQLVH